MNNSQNTYNQQAQMQGQVVAPPIQNRPIPPVLAKAARQARKEGILFDMSLANKCVLFYLLALTAVSILFMEYALPLWLIVFGTVSVLVFFYGTAKADTQWIGLSEKRFVKNLFWMALAIRLLYIIFIYYFNMAHYGHYFESNEGDITWYVPSALDMAKQLSYFNIVEVVNKWESWGVDLADMGYVIYLAVLYLIFGFVTSTTDSIPLILEDDMAPMGAIIIPLIIKAILGAWTCVLIYKVTKRHFGEDVARLTGIFCMLQTNMIWWCGSMMKETEMIFLTFLYLNQMDTVLSRGSFNIKELVGGIFIGLLLFTFRTVLGLVAFGAMFMTIIMSSSRVVNWGKKVFAGALVALVLAFSYGDRIMSQVQEAKEAVTDRSRQQTNMEWRTKRDNGNAFAKYAGAAVFAPLIFTIPFPNMVYTFERQEMQMMVNGGNYEKNILSFFVILVMVIFLLRKSWRPHVFPIAFLIGYLLALVFSVFAQSGRFHMPIIPLEMMFAAYGISLMKGNKKFRRWFGYTLVIEVVVCVAWGWFKLAGRGMI